MTDWWGSKEWANDELRFGIRIINGDIVKTRKLTDLLAIALDVKSWLEREGFWWQAKTLDHHIHLWQAKHRKELKRLRKLSPGGLHR